MGNPDLIKLVPAIYIKQQHSSFFHEKQKIRHPMIGNDFLFSFKKFFQDYLSRIGFARKMLEAL